MCKKSNFIEKKKHYILFIMLLTIVGLLANVCQASSPRQLDPGFLFRKLTILQPLTNPINSRYLIPNPESNIYQRQNSTFDTCLYDRNINGPFINAYSSQGNDNTHLLSMETRDASTENHYATNPKQAPEKKEEAFDGKGQIFDVANVLLENPNTKQRIQDPLAQSDDTMMLATVSKVQTDIQKELSQTKADLQVLVRTFKEQQQKNHTQNLESILICGLLQQKVHQLEEILKDQATPKEVLEQNQNILHESDANLKMIKMAKAEMYEYKSSMEKKHRRWESRMAAIAVMYWFMLFLGYPIKMILYKVSLFLLNSLSHS